jgi:CHAT domain-containing protein
MRPRSIARLAEQASEGSVVLLYTTWHRSDALILSANPGQYVRVVPLTGVTPDGVTAQNRKLAAAFEASASHSAVTRKLGEQEIGEVLAWLWDYITGPVLQALESPAGTSQIWWCPVGELAFLPLHAAGRHMKQVSETGHEGARITVLDQVISSYTPTIRSLEHARRRSPGRRNGSPTALIVAMPETHFAPPLPGVTAEAEYVARLFRDSLVLAGSEATSQAVQAALAKYEIAHFACHGVSDSVDPGSSKLLLYDYASQPLTVAAISVLRLQNAAMAFLSACSTAISNEKLADEAVHITAAFQLAGYSKVIGTLWPNASG